MAILGSLLLQASAQALPGLLSGENLGVWVRMALQYCSPDPGGAVLPPLWPVAPGPISHRQDKRGDTGSGAAREPPLLGTASANQLRAAA